MIQKPVLLLSISCVALRSSFGTLLQQVKKYFLFVLILSMILSACSNNASKEPEFPSSDSSVFYPEYEFLKTQFNSIDTTLTIMYVYTDSDNKTDSEIISPEKFIEIAAPFTEYNINDVSVKKYYRETVFNDQTTASNTFSYVSSNASLPVQTVDILLDTTSGDVQHLFMTRSLKKADSTIEEKMGWNTNSSFYINRIIHLSSKEITQRISVFWRRKM